MALEALKDLPNAAPGYLLAVLGARGEWVAREELQTSQLTALPAAAALDPVVLVEQATAAVAAARAG